MVDNAYRDKLHKIRAIYDIFNHVKASKNIDDWRWFNPKKSTKMADLVATLPAAIEDDCRICVLTLATVHDMSAGTIFNIIHDELGLVKKSARWVSKLLSRCQMNKRMGMSADFVKLVQEKGRDVLSKIITVDESTVSMSMNTNGTKHQSMHWL
jgi:hypothetical protein